MLAGRRLDAPDVQELISDGHLRLQRLDVVGFELYEPRRGARFGSSQELGRSRLPSQVRLREVPSGRRGELLEDRHDAFSADFADRGFDGADYSDVHA
jgi:hypothetical protein